MIFVSVYGVKSLRLRPKTNIRPRPLFAGRVRGADELARMGAGVLPIFAGLRSDGQIGAWGLWRGEFTPPWDWRHGARQAANENVAGKCLVKGNVSSKGERIYHVPGGQYYERTKINAARGERWFCTEAEARTAGWRASKR